MIGCPISPCDSPGRGRRRRWDSSAFSSESSPLQVDVSSGLSLTNYSTFTNRSHKQQQECRPGWWLFLTRSWSDILKQTGYHSHSSLLAADPPQQSPAAGPLARNASQPFDYPWKALYVVLVLAVLMAFYHGRSEENLGVHRRHYAAPKSQWDHNIYETPSDGAFLVAQLDGYSGLGTLTDISSRPNRAYCRQNKIDYVRYTRGGRSPYIQKSCFDQVILLNVILDKQLRDSKDGPFLPSLFSLPPRIDYDTVALLPPDSIVMNLDSNMFDLLPKHKLVAIAGWNKHYAKSFAQGDGQFASQTGVLFFNLRHKHANAVAKLWWDWVESPAVSCGAGNDLTLLVDAISAVLEDGEDLSSVIASLEESDHGFVGRSAQEDVIQGIPPSTPTSRAQFLLNNLADNTVKLQTTADSVCYRYYPQCEVL